MLLTVNISDMIKTGTLLFVAGLIGGVIIDEKIHKQAEKNVKH